MIRSLITLAVAALPVFGITVPYTFQEIAYPNDAFVQLLGINSSNTIAGYHNADVNKGFTLVLPRTFTAENYPNSAQTQVVGINNAGNTGGFYIDAQGTVHGYSLIKGTYATVDAPNTAFNQLLGLNNAGEMVGYSSTDPKGATLQLAFMVQTNGVIKYLPQPAGTTNSQATGINDAHTICGFYVDADGNNHGFLVTNGVQTTLDYPNSTFTQVLGINNNGQVVGQYQDIMGGTHGFVYVNGTFQSIDEPMSAAGTTVVNGINDQGLIVGFFQDMNGNTVGLVGTPQPVAVTMIFRAVLLPANEMPVVTSQATGTADVVAHAVVNSAGQITSGTVNFLVRTNLTSTDKAVGLTIQNNSTTGQNASLTIPSGLSPANSMALSAGAGSLQVPVQISSTGATLSALSDLFQNPGNYYVNLSTSSFPNGAMRGTLQQARWTVLMGAMAAGNVVPPLTNTSTSGMAQVVAIGTQDATGKWTSGEVYLTTTYSGLTDPSAFTGLNLHVGATGTAAAVAIAGSLPSGIRPAGMGAGVVGPFQTEISLTNTTQTAAFNDLFMNPNAIYMDISNSTNSGGFLRAQLRATDTISFPVLLDSANESIVPSVKATAPSAITLNTLRNPDGSIAAATIWFDVNYRLPAMATFSGLSITDTTSGKTISMVPSYDAAFLSTTGVGNYFNWTPPITDTATLNDIMTGPENLMVNLQTMADPAGVARSALAPAVTMTPNVMATVSADLDPEATNAAPGEIVSIFGMNLSKVTGGLSGWAGSTLPTSLNGAKVTVGGTPAALLYVSSTQMNVQIPLNAGMGAQDLIVNNGVGASDAFSVTITPAAPAIFFYPVAAVIRVANDTVVSSANAAHAGDQIIALATGLGQTTPPLNTGQVIQPGTIANTASVTATIGGTNAPVLSSTAFPLSPGVYEITLSVPSGVTGSVPLVLKMGSVSSNAVNIMVQ